MPAAAPPNSRTRRAARWSRRLRDGTTTRTGCASSDQSARAASCRRRSSPSRYASAARAPRAITMEGSGVTRGGSYPGPRGRCGHAARGVEAGNGEPGNRPRPNLPSLARRRRDDDVPQPARPRPAPPARQCLGRRERPPDRGARRPGDRDHQRRARLVARPSGRRPPAAGRAGRRPRGDRARRHGAALGGHRGRLLERSPRGRRDGARASSPRAPPASTSRTAARRRICCAGRSRPRARPRRRPAPTCS